MSAMVFAISVAAILAVCVLGVLHPRYEDNLVQRAGMAVAALGALAELWWQYHGHFKPDAADVVFAGGVALFAIGTVLKKVLAPRRRRRSTDRKTTN